MIQEKPSVLQKHPEVWSKKKMKFLHYVFCGSILDLLNPDLDPKHEGMVLCWWPMEDNEPGHAMIFIIQEKPSVLQKNNQKFEQNLISSRFLWVNFGPPGSGSGTETPDGSHVGDLWRTIIQDTPGLSWYRTFRSLKKNEITLLL